MTEQEAEKLERLVTRAQELSDEVEQMAEKSGTQFVSLAATAKRNRLMIWGILIGGVLDLVLTVALILFGVGQEHNANRLDALTRQLDNSQTVQRQKVLCPLYGVLLDSRSDAGRAAAPDPQKYDHAFTVIQDGYDALQCSAFLTP